MSRFGKIASLLIPAALLAACGQAPPSTSALPWQRADNLLANGSFEKGREPWFSLKDESPFWRDFQISDTVALSGRHSARLSLDSLQFNDRGTWVWGVARDVPVTRLPRRVSGAFRVHGWQQGTPNQYLQVAVSITPREEGFIILPDPKMPLQVAWVLAGIDREPFRLGNRRFLFPGPLEMPQDRWVNFEFDLHGDFQAAWGIVPDGFAKLRLLFEARYDGWQPGHGEVSGDVFFDDLYLGDGDESSAPKSPAP